MSSQPNIGPDIAIFWGIETIGSCPKYPHGDLHFSPQLGLDLVEIADSFNQTPNKNVSMMTFCEVNSISQMDRNILEDIGFQIITTSRETSLFPDMSVYILLWLWDRSRHEPTSKSPTIIVVSNDTKCLKLLQMLKSRGVFIILLSDLVQVQLNDCKLVSNLIVDVNFNDRSSKFKYINVNSDVNSGVSKTESESSTSEKSSSGHYDPIFEKWINDRDTTIPTTSIESQSHYQVVSGSASGFKDLSGLNTSSTKAQHQYDVDILSGKYGNLLGTTNSTPSENLTRDPDPFSMLQRQQLLMKSQKESLQNEFSFRNDLKSLRESHDFLNEPIYTFFSYHIDEFSSDLENFSNMKLNPDELSFEQRSMQEQLVSCFRQRNIQLTVSTLRKIYTKQCRVFRIPVILASVLPVAQTDLTQPFGQYAQSAVIFTLNCIQWSIGAQKNSNAESFKYKMNKKISYWLLKEQIRKGVPPYYIPDVGNVAVSVTQSVLKQVMELDLALEILQVMKVPNPMEHLVSFVYSWSVNPDPNLAAKAKEFGLQFGIPLSVPHGPRVHGLGSIGNQMMLDSGLDHPLFGSSARPGMGVLGGSLGSSSFGSLRNSVASTSQIPDSQDEVVQQRLFLMLKKYPDGILGSRIPIIYRDEFQEQLRLRGQKLKDIMLGLGAEMVGDEGPGDKVFLFPPGRLL